MEDLDSKRETIIKRVEKEFEKKYRKYRIYNRTLRNSYHYFKVFALARHTYSPLYLRNNFLAFVAAVSPAFLLSSDCNSVNK